MSLESSGMHVVPIFLNKFGCSSSPGKMSRIMSLVLKLGFPYESVSRIGPGDAPNIGD